MRILILGLVGGLAMFLWSGALHNSPVAQIGVQALPGEGAVVTNLASAIGDRSGLFLFPMDMAAKSSSATGPGGFLVFNAHSPLAMKPSNLIAEVLTEIAASLVAAWLLAQTAIAGFGKRVLFVTGIGAATAIIGDVPYWNWYGFPLDYTLAYGFIQLGGFAAAGLAMALYLRWLKA